MGPRDSGEECATAASLRGRHERESRIPLQGGRGSREIALVYHHLELAGRTNPESPLDERVTLARVGIVRHGRDRRHPGP